MITTLDRLERSTQKILELAEELRDRNTGLRVLNLGGVGHGTAKPVHRIDPRPNVHHTMYYTVFAVLVAAPKIDGFGDE